MINSMIIRKRRNAVIVGIFIIFATLLFQLTISRGGTTVHDLRWKQEQYPLVWQHIHMSRGQGGAWYIPQSWLATLSTPPHPKNITDAALLANYLANTAQSKHLAHSNIPRIIHQTWQSAEIEHIPEKDAVLMETWLQYATNPGSEMAYFMWDDDGAADLIATTEPHLVPFYNLLPKPVEKSDVFRVVVCNSIGGVYADIDTKLLRDPAKWIDEADISQWTDSQTNVTYGNASQLVGFVLGIEADTDELTDDYWRMGYTYPVQLTQWALAGAPRQPIMIRFLQNFKAQIQDAMRQAFLDGSDDDIETTSGSPGGNSQVQIVLRSLDPLELTGPAAITRATKDYLEAHAGLRWQAVSGLEDGGRSKLVLDTLILPITGFSPGRGKYGNMGSKPIDHPDARLQHLAQGSWRKLDLKVQLGKLCRSLLGQCRDWSRVPST